jgi:hypothetical protein
MVAHGPDDLGAKIPARRFNDRTKLGVGLGVAFVRQVTGEDDGFRACARGLNLVEKLDQAGFAVNGSIKGVRTSQQVGVTQVE